MTALSLMQHLLLASHHCVSYSCQALEGGTRIDAVADAETVIAALQVVVS